MTGAILATVAGPAVYWHHTNTALTNLDVEALAATPLSPTILYAGTWGDGVFRSTDNGASWVTATNGITLPFNVGGALALTVRPPVAGSNDLDRITLYAGDYYNGGVYRSADGGQHWSLSLPNVGTRAIAIDPLTPTIVYVGDRDTGLYRTPDGGGTWTATNAGLTDTHIGALAATRSTVYAGAASSVFTSTNHGVNWTWAHTFSSTVQVLAVHPITSGVIYAGTISHGLWRSRDGGASWTAAGSGLPAGTWITSLAFDALDPAIIYAGLWSGQVYRSTDNGETWTGLGYLGTVHALAAQPAARNVIYAGTSNNGLFRGSALHHITLDPISTTQYVNRPFTLTITARDALGFPLSGATSAQLHDLARHAARLANTLAAGYTGSARLADTAGLITPTSVNLINGVAVQPVVFKQAITRDTITATLKIEGLPAASNPFRVRWFAQIALPLVMKMMVK